MLTPAVANRLPWFQPLLNRPAVNLLQHIPPKQKADVLLLGCGGVQNFLFTAHLNPSQVLDVTACDLEPAVLARNILILSVVGAYNGQEINEVVWNLYFHLFLDRRSIEILSEHASTLLDASTSLETWIQSRWSKYLKFCDQSTLLAVRDVWTSYRYTRMTESEQVKFVSRFRDNLAVAQDKRDVAFTQEKRSVADYHPLSPTSPDALADLACLSERVYWTHGTVNASPRYEQIPTAAEFPNPMFLSSTHTMADTYWQTNPFAGFHLAAAYCPLVRVPAADQNDPGSSAFHSATATIREDFRQWCQSFRGHVAQGTVLRFFWGDGLALGHKLQNLSTTAGDGNTNMYRSQLSAEMVALDLECNVPTSFDVIDTAHLAEQYGTLNVMSAAAPLLRDRSSAMYTKSLVRLSGPLEEIAKDLLCGSLSTMSLLLNMYPAELWTNTTSTSVVEGDITREHMRQKHGEVPPYDTGEDCWRILWRKSMYTRSSAHRWGEGDLANALFHVYLRMFPSDSNHDGSASTERQATRSLSRYNRASFASLLRLVRVNTIVDWDETVELLLGLISSTASDKQHIWDLKVQVQLLQVDQIFTPYEQNLPATAISKGLGLHASEVSLVAVTLKIPRSRLSSLTQVKSEWLSAVVFFCKLKSKKVDGTAGQSHSFDSVQLVFGQVVRKDSQDENRECLHIKTDFKAWRGTTPLFASFYVPRRLLDTSPGASVALAVKKTPDAVAYFGTALDPAYEIYSTGLRSEGETFVARYLPNTSGHMLLPKSVPVESTAETGDYRTEITVNYDNETRRVTSLTGRLTLLSEKYRDDLRAGNQLNVLRPAPNVVEITQWHGNKTISLEFPFPSDDENREVCVDRAAGYILIIPSPLYPHVRNTDPLYPLLLENGEPVNLIMPRVDLDRLPLVDTSEPCKLGWLINHIEYMFTPKERILRRELEIKSLLSDAVRLNFKETLFAMFVKYVGRHGDRTRIFGITHKGSGGTCILIFVSGIRLDLANRVPVLDAAILPLTNKLVLDMQNLLATLKESKICCVKADDGELVLWKKCLPAFVERCRQWKHRTTCEYRKGRIPISFEVGEQVLCTCGFNSLPRRYKFPVAGWDKFRRHAIQGAISPSFSVSSAEELLDGLGLASNKDDHASTKRCRGCKREQSEAGSKLLVCSRCQKASYCSRDCQRADWKKHKLVCSQAIAD